MITYGPDFTMQSISMLNQERLLEISSFFSFFSFPQKNFMFCSSTAKFAKSSPLKTRINFLNYYRMGVIGWKKQTNKQAEHT